MPISATTIATRFTAIMAESPGRVSVTIGAETHYGHPTPERRQTKYLPEGSNADRRESVTVLLSDWTTAPAARAVATIGGVEYRVLAVNRDSLNVTATLELGPKHGA